MQLAVETKGSEKIGKMRFGSCVNLVEGSIPKNSFNILAAAGLT
jgi:hypothetical protein